jgi:hypothetical protein
MSKWPTAGHFASGLNLCPDNDIIGGKTLWRGMRTVKNRAGHLFRLAASSLHHSPTPLGNYLRRMKAKLGPSPAITATAHKIAVIFYTLVKHQAEYDETIWAARDTQREKRLEARLKRQAKQLGYDPTLVKTGSRLIKHALYYWLLLAESHPTRRLFRSMVRPIAALPLPTG